MNSWKYYDSSKSATDPYDFYRHNEDVNVSGDEFTFGRMANWLTDETSVVLSGVKTLENKDLENKMFSFELYEGDTLKETVQNPTNGHFAFTAIEYTASDVGTHTYTVKEVLTGTTKDSDGQYVKEGIIYDKTEYTVTVEVTQGDDGKISAKVTSNNATALNFKNKYSAETSATVEVSKDLVGKTLAAGQFSFTMTPVTEGAPMPEGSVTKTEGEGDDAVTTVSKTVTNAADGRVSFGSIAFDQDDSEKTYVYKIVEDAIDAETNPGITQDTTNGPSAIYAKVVVGKDNGDGTMENCAVTYYSDEACATQLETAKFVNKYEATGSLKLEATKTMKGMWPENVDKFTFGVESTSAYTGYTTPTAELVDGMYEATNEKRTADLGTMAFSLANVDATTGVGGPFTYTITEDHPEGATKDADGNWVKDDVTYDGSSHVVKFYLKDNGAGQIVICAADGTDGACGTEGSITVDGKTVAVSDGKASVGAFTNSYEATGDVTFEGTKSIDCRELADGDTFTFTVKEGETTVAEVTNDATGKIAYPTISYVKNATTDQTGTHTYTVVESVSTVEGVTKSSVEHEVTVTVTDDGDGTLEVEPSDNYQALDFENAYEAKGSITLEGTKTIDTRDIAEGETFEFAVYDADGNEVATGSSDDGGKITFTAIDYVKNATTDQTGTHTYTVVETTKDGNGITVDTREHKAVVTVTDLGNGKLDAKLDEEQSDIDFVNQYEATGSVTFAGTKTMEGRELTADDAFSFAVTEDGKNVATATSDATGKIAYPTIEYTLSDVGEHTYVVREASTDGNGVTVDTRTYTVTVKVEDVNHNGKLTVTASDNATALDFVNTYEAKGDVTFAGTKTLEGRALTADDVFTFTIIEGDKTIATVSNDATGKIAYPTISYTLADVGTHTYTVRETSTDGNGVTVDTRTYTVTVKVEDNGDGTLKVTPSDNATALDFVNAYDAKGSFEIKGLSKVLRNGSLKAKQFSFELKDADGKVLQTVTNDAKGNISFDALSYTLADLGGAGSKTFKFTVSEVIPAGATKNADGTYTQGKITYSGDVVSFEVTVSDNGDGTLAFSGVTDGVLDLGHQFVNTTKPDVPHTGDVTNYGLMYALAAAGLVVLGSGVSVRRRRRRA